MARLFLRIFYLSLIIAAILSLLYLPSHFQKRESKSLNIFVWGDLLNPASVAQFEEVSGIKTRLHYFNSNEELLVKLRRSKGEGYDLICCSDYAIKALKDNGYLAPLDKKQLPFYEQLDPFLLDHPFDPENQYSLPYNWEVIGLAVDKKIITSPFKPSLAQLFDPNLIDYKMIMTADPVEAVLFASLYLFNKTESLSPEEVLAIKKLLKDQKSFVEAYADSRAKYFLSTKNCPVAVLRNSYLYQILQDNPDVSFLLPEEGIFTSIENMAILKSCKNQAAAYAFLNYFYKPEVLAAQVDFVPLFPALPAALEHIHQPQVYFDLLNEISARRKPLFFHYPLPQEELQTLWVEVKTS